MPGNPQHEGRLLITKLSSDCLSVRAPPIIAVVPAQHVTTSASMQQQILQGRTPTDKARHLLVASVLANCRVFPRCTLQINVLHRAAKRRVLACTALGSLNRPAHWGMAIDNSKGQMQIAQAEHPQMTIQTALTAIGTPPLRHAPQWAQPQSNTAWVTSCCQPAQGHRPATERPAVKLHRVR